MFQPLLQKILLSIISYLREFFKNVCNLRFFMLKYQCYIREELLGGKRMEIIKYILIGIYVIVCLALIIVAMMQSKDDSGMSGAISGSSSSNFYEKNKGRTKEGKMKRWTIILGITFAVLTIVISIMYVI